MAFLRAVWQLFVYFTIGIVPLVFSIFVRVALGKKRAFKFLFVIDVCICVLAHGEFRTISGMTGERAVEHKRYEIQQQVINWIFKHIDGDYHCERINQNEIDINYNYFEYFKGL